MEFIHGRPPLGEIYCPTRITLNEENEYLVNVGLIVLIRGSPSPDLPRLVAEKMVQTHGGQLADYEVAEAMIAPYTITCPNTRTRDALVHRGLYSIPQVNVQFTVHEWRPRFGMGHDPPAYQVWIKIIGLPLQAWTATEINQILRKFGHPTQILPFGREAGHYRDITALVATKHPRNIPLSYVYREGDYTTQIDVLILSWRQWEDTYFPPPGNPPHQYDPPAQPHQPHQHDGQLTPRRRPPSSSSSNAPYEPSIDYSSWSPRSYQLTAHRFIPKLQQTFRHTIPDSPPLTTPPLPPLALMQTPTQPQPLSTQPLNQCTVAQLLNQFPKCPTRYQEALQPCDQTPLAPAQLAHLSMQPRPLFQLTDPLQIPLFHFNGHTAATENLRSLLNLQQIFSEIYLSLANQPCPITINPLFLLSMLSAQDCTFGAPQSTAPVLLPHLSHRLVPMLALAKEGKLNLLVTVRATRTPPFQCRGHAPKAHAPKAHAPAQDPTRQQEAMHLYMDRGPPQPIMAIAYTAGPNPPPPNQSFPKRKPKPTRTLLCSNLSTANPLYFSRLKSQLAQKALTPSTILL